MLQSFLLILCIGLVCMPEVDHTELEGDHGKWKDLLYPPPSSDQPALRVHAELGTAVILPCTVASARHLPVWVRRRDYHILTEGDKNYITDGRFEPLFHNQTHAWSLKIQPSRLTDSGTYECQVTGGRVHKSSFVQLEVYQAVASLSSNQTYANQSGLHNGPFHFQRGSPIRLYCHIENSPVAPVYIFWYHGSDMINYISARQRLSIEITSNSTSSSARSSLNIDNAQPSDTGNYSCQSSNAQPVSALVFVSQGDNLAAVHRINSGSRGHTFTVPTGWCVAIIVLIYCDYG